MYRRAVQLSKNAKAISMLRGVENYYGYGLAVHLESSAISAEETKHFSIHGIFDIIRMENFWVLHL